MLDDPAALYIPARSVIRDVGSARALALARQHIDRCVDTHVHCKSAAESPSPRLPTRLVDCTDLARPRLVSTTGGCGEFLALSYVWGEDQVHKTTSANISTYTQCIPPDRLPPTIRDAIYVTHMLGFRWLWVDSLCIIQDSDDDKLHEIGHMHHIYRYAHLTIIAASAKGVSEGFLQERPPSHVPGLDRTGSAAQSRVDTMYAVSSSSELCHGWYKYEFGHMATRAWCMQEYLLSPRALIFTPTTVMFRCISATQAVGNSLYHWVSDREPRIPKSLFLPHTATAAPTPEKWRDIHNAWTEVVEDYTRRTASVESDKLVACAAVAEQFHRALGSDYLAGLWRSDALLAHLLWSVDLQNTDRLRYPHTRPAAYRAPSWSWAAIEGLTSHRYPRDLSLRDPQTVALAEVAECSVTLEDPALSFGRVTDGVLVLRGTL
ncbi:HET-domain-containing protein, partial [Trametes versicolor FP-101664 SS1]|uniref:HET-domain-containing protein n=1 Tax=Trametes versicolor (strain FP-101664) TaxID=717944 RepID=UPI00046222D6